MAACSTLRKRADLSLFCFKRLPIDQADAMTMAERLDAGDEEAIYDAIVEAEAELAAVRAEVGELLVDGERETLDRLRQLHEDRLAGRPNDMDAAGTDASGRERQRSRMDRSGPANHGR